MRPFRKRSRRSGLLTQEDAFRHHPDLRGKIRPAAESAFRDLDLDGVDAYAAGAGFPAGWRTPCAERERDRHRWLKDRQGQDLWVFAYGSLMWDPSILFDEVRKARCLGHQRSFCLWDDGGRGSREVPGLMLAIDEGPGCEGLAFRVPGEVVDHETFVLFRREMLAPVYRPAWLALDTAAGPIEALGFVANRGHPDIRPGIPQPQQARMIARAKGLFGSNFDYLSDLHRQLDRLGVADPHVSALYDATLALRGPSQAG